MYYDGRRCHPLILYGEEEYRVWRSKHASVMVQRKRHFTITHIDSGEIEYWSTLTHLRGYYGQYLWSDRSGKLATNKKWAEKGKVWIAHYKLLLSGSLWEVRCDDWDGQGTPCPHQYERKDGTMGCPIDFWFMGYSGHYPPEKPLPGVCPSSINSSHSTNLCLPTKKDEYGFDFQNLIHIRNEIWKRSN